jgi:hypothetical protein
MLKGSDGPPTFPELNQHFDQSKLTKVKVCVTVLLVTPDELKRVTQIVYADTWGNGATPLTGAQHVIAFRDHIKPWVLVAKKQNKFLGGLQNDQSKG